MKRYRIKQISENQFIPQVQESIWDFFLNDWLYLEYNERHDTVYSWYCDAFESQCIVNSVDKAKLVIEKYKEITQKSSKYPKYHKA